MDVTCHVLLHVTSDQWYGQGHGKDIHSHDEHAVTAIGCACEQGTRCRVVVWTIRTLEGSANQANVIMKQGLSFVEGLVDVGWRGCVQG